MGEPKMVGKRKMIEGVTDKATRILATIKLHSMAQLAIFSC